MALEFKISRLRYTWAGYWNTSTFYNRDAVVSYNGKTYVCLVPHTSGNFYEDLDHFEVETGSTPYWEIMFEGNQWKGEWTPNSSYTLGNIVHYTGTVYKCIVNHTSGPEVISLENWEIVAAGNSSWAGDYSSNTLYRVGEVVKYNGITYQCIEEHTSQPTLVIDESKWTVVNVGIEYKGEWNGNNFNYRKNDIVKYGANLWISTYDHLSTSPFDEEVWDLWIPGLQYENMWSSTTSYQAGDVVRYGGYIYTSKITNNIGKIPTINSVEWELMTSGYNLKQEWSTSIFYEIGSVVLRGGNAFVAILDNQNQDPTDSLLTKIYISAGSNGNIVKLSNTTGLVPGMMVTGSGFDTGQYISNVIDANTIEVSSPPNIVLDDSVPLIFNGVNSPSWELLSAGTRWRNRWSDAGEYVIGDIVVWKNATYRCVNTHSSDNLSRPDLDVTKSLWILYINHDQYNVLNKPGDIIVNSNGTNEALAIGSEGFLLKSIYGIPTWSNVFQTPEVYYVTPDGTDLVTSGDTWDNPYKTIKFACEQIAKGTLNRDLTTQLLLNKQFIIEEVRQWVDYQTLNAISPFASNQTLEASKTKRDTSFLLDAILYDLTRGGNSQTIAFVYSYFDKEYSDRFSTPEVAALMPQFIAAINRTFEVLFTVLSNVPLSPSYQVLNNAGTIINQAQGPLIGNQAIVDIQSLQDIVVTALVDADTSTIPPENNGLTATLMVKTGTYEEELPIVVPANTALVGDELRGVVVKPKLVINTIATRSQTGINLITVKTTEGLENGTPVQFVSINPVTGVNSVFGGLEAGLTYYVIGSSITSTKFAVGLTAGGPPVTLTNNIGQMRVYGAGALSDMFYVQNGSGIRNMTLSGLLGTLTEPNDFTTRRPTGGSYVSLDPGSGPSDTSAWVYRKSPYIQNVTTFGVGATGLKIDGNLHNGGNKSIVCNDFTQIISDGIGIWCTGPESLCEAVSVFAYYAYSGYFAENGGRIRATNGNSSYGTYGVIAEGYNENETPISGLVDNRYFEASATPLSSLGGNAEILKLQYSHAGENYITETTNLLVYSNLFTNWASDGNITLIQSIVAPSGQSDGWIATGNTSGTDSSYFYQDITVAPSGATYTALSGDSQTGGGVGATFDVAVTSTQYIVTVNNGGSGYVATNQIQINGSKLGGIDGINDLIITVVSLTGTSISTISVTGTVQAGSIQPYTFSIYCKKGTASLFDVTATFSGYSSVTSGVSFDLINNSISGTSGTGGMTPTILNAQPVSNQDGWFRLSFQFYDITALNNSLQIRIYPRSKTGNSGYTLLYGAQLEVGNNLGFYLKTTTERFTSYANYDVFGAGTGVDLIGDETRSESVYQTRVLEIDGNVGGRGYLLSSNNAQTGNETSIVIAGSDVAGEKDYLGMRVFINSGLGAGQYGVVSSFDTTSKLINVLRESFEPVTVDAADSATSKFTLSAFSDITTLYVNQPVQFIPTNYAIEVTNVSQRSITVLQTVGGTTNTIKVSSTARLAPDMPITFSGNVFGGVTIGFTYYVLSVIDNTTIQISTTLAGAAVLLNNVEGQTMDLNYPSNTSQLIGNTNDMDVNLPIYFTGNVLSTIEPGKTYYINEIYSNTEFTISPDLVTVTAAATTAVTNNITVDDTSALRQINPIKFTGGSVFGNLVENTKYYINHILDLTRVSVSSQVIDTMASSSLDSSNLITVIDTTGFIIGNPVVFTGTTFGNIVNDKIYYIHYVNNSNTFSISNTSTPISVTVTQTAATTNILTVSATTNLTPLHPITFSGTTFGGITAGTEYYINRIINSTTLSVSPSIISVTVSETQAVSNLITVTSTTGFVANNPIIFGGATFGGIISGTVYYVSAINDSTTLTVSTTPSGSAVNLSSATGTATGRTTSASVTLTSATGSMTGNTRYTGSPVDLSTGVGECAVRTTGESVALATATGSMTGISTSIKEILSADTGSMTGTFSVPLFGGVMPGSTYYVKDIISGTPNTFTVSDTPGGPAASISNGAGSMRMGELGWDHVNPGTPPASIFDSTTVYSIEPLIYYSKPEFVTASNTNIVQQAPGTEYVSIGYGQGKFVALANGNLTLAVSTDGNSWSQQQLPSSATWSDIAYGNKYWVIISTGGASIPGSKVLFSNSGLLTWKTSYLPTIGNWSKIIYGNGKFVAITNNSSSSAYSVNFGTTWSAGTGLPNTTWSDLTYGSGRFVAVASGGTIAAVSTNGQTWTQTVLPRSSSWSSVRFGNGRFVAISSTGGLAAYSFDGITWYEARYTATGDYLSYGNGVFLATSNSGSAAYTSEDGIVWFTRTVPTSTGITQFGFNASNTGIFVGVSGQNSVSIIKAGSQTKARPAIYQNTIVSINEWDPGSNYTVSPTITIVDSNATKPAVAIPAIGNGVLGNPTFYNKGSGYSTTSTSITITGDGYAQNYQIGLALIFKDLTRLPSAGDNLTIQGNPIVYKVTEATVLDGTEAPTIRALIGISPSMTAADSPNHSTRVTIRTKYSQVRLTNHDFLNIGYGNIEQSNYPGLPTSTLLSPENEAVESNYGRVFYSSTDQDGNFRVGKLFAVEQATGIVTLSASQFGLEGLSELRLGGIAVGGNSVIITQFSTDSTFVANSNSIIPTQKAIKGYLTARLSQGGANTFTGQLIAGTVLIGGPDKIASTIPEGNDGSHVNIPVKVNVNGFEDGGWDGDGMALSYFMKTFSTGSDDWKV